MKRIICFLLVLSCCMAVEAIADKTACEMVFSSDFCNTVEPGNYGVGHVVYLENTFYGIIGEKLYSWNSEESGNPSLVCTLPINNFWDESFWTETRDTLSTEQMEQLISRVDGLAVGEGKLWGYNLLGGKIGEIRNDGINWLPVNLDTTTFYREGGLVVEFSPCRAFVINSFLYFFGEKNDSFELVRISLETGLCEKINISGALNCCIYQDNKLLLIRPNGKSNMKLSVLDPDMGTMEDLPADIPFTGIKEEETVGGLAFASDSGQICFYMEETIWTTDGIKEATAVGDFRKMNAFEGMPLTSDFSFPAWITTDGRYAICMYCSLFIRELKEEGGQSAGARIR